MRYLSSEEWPPSEGSSSTLSPQVMQLSKACDPCSRELNTLTSLVPDSCAGTLTPTHMVIINKNDNKRNAPLLIDPRKITESGQGICGWWWWWCTAWCVQTPMRTFLVRGYIFIERRNWKGRHGSSKMYLYGLL